MRFSRRTFTQASLAALAAGCARSDSGPLIVHGGPIYTGRPLAPSVEAVRIEDGRFAFAGALADARSGARAREIDLGGAAAFPGFTDCHVHLSAVGQSSMLLDLVGVESIAALQARLRTYAGERREGAIFGRGWIETHWPEARFPTRADLDSVVADRPVFLERIDGHAAIVNGAALALAGIEANTPNPPGGVIERDASGAATGMLIDNAMALVQSRLPAPTPAMRAEALARGARIYAERGWSGVHNMSTDAEELALFQRFGGDGSLPLFAELYVTVEAAAALFERGPTTANYVRVRGIKLYLDGALGSRGAALLSPYADAPGQSGLLLTTETDLRGLLSRMRGRGLQLALHAIGDRGNRMALDAIADAFGDAEDDLRAARWRIEHAQVIGGEDIARFGEMGVIASMQPSHAISDLHFAPARLGPQRLAGAYAWRSLLDSGAVIAGGSDAPVEKGDPLIEFYAAVHRHDLSGFAGPDWRLDQAVSREQALALFTSAAAYAGFADHERGTIEVGKRADLSAFSVDLMQAEPQTIPTAAAVFTLSDGRVTHDAL